MVGPSQLLRLLPSFSVDETCDHGCIKQAKVANKIPSKDVFQNACINAN